MMRPHRFPRWAAVALAVAAFLLLIRQSTSQQVEGLGSRVVAPVQAGLSALQAETGRFVDTLRRVRALAEENRRLQEENDRLRSEIMRLSEVEVENRDLRSLLELKERDDTVEFIPARVIGRDVVPYVSALTIDGGRAAGMEEQMAVVTRRGLAGQIVEVHPTTARVLLITDVNSSVSARIQNPESRATGVVRGRVEGGWSCSTSRRTSGCRPAIGSSRREWAGSSRKASSSGRSFRSDGRTWTSTRKR